jgi:hypothetical protein
MKWIDWSEGSYTAWRNGNHWQDILDFINHLSPGALLTCRSTRCWLLLDLLPHCLVRFAWIFFLGSYWQSYICIIFLRIRAYFWILRNYSV